MMTRAFPSTLVLALSIAGFGRAAQAGDQRTALTVEFGGRTGDGSLNLDYLLLPQFALGVGASYISVTSGGNSSTNLIIPLYANYYFWTGKSHPYITGGADIVMGSGSGTTSKFNFAAPGIAKVFGIGYEYRDGFVFRFTPYVLLGNVTTWWLGMSLGFAF